MTNHPDAVLIAPDGCTKYLASSIERDLGHMADGSTLEVQMGSRRGRHALSRWAREQGHHVAAGTAGDRADRLYIGVREGRVA